MCTENKEYIDISKKHEKDIMEAVAIIKNFEPDIKMFHSMLKVHSKRIDEEVEERKDENKRITDNYIKRFDDLSKKLEDGLKEVRADIKTSLFGILGFLVITIAGFIVSKVLGVL